MLVTKDILSNKKYAKQQTTKINDIYLAKWNPHPSADEEKVRSSLQDLPITIKRNIVHWTDSLT